MSLSPTHNRIVRHGFKAEDLAQANDLGADIVMLEGNQIPSMVSDAGSTIYLPGAGASGDASGKVERIPFSSCVSFTVLAVSSLLSEAPPRDATGAVLGLSAAELQRRIDLRPGDVILAQNIVLDPLYRPDGAERCFGYGRLPLCFVKVIERAAR